MCVCVFVCVSLCVRVRERGEVAFCRQALAGQQCEFGRAALEAALTKFKSSDARASKVDTCKKYPEK